jgi:CTP synthase (UTP-ammonia lyase)
MQNPGWVLFILLYLMYTAVPAFRAPCARAARGGCRTSHWVCLKELIGLSQSIALLGEYDPAFPPHPATEAAIEHSSAQLGLCIDRSWVSTEDIDSRLFERHSGIWVAPGSPYRNIEKTLWAIRFARENRIPCLGTCGGFQHMIIEYARNVCGFEDAQHAEYDPYASRLFISRLACSLAGRDMALSFVAGSRAASIYGALSATERYYCNFGVNPDYLGELTKGPLKVSGSDREGEIRVVEDPAHPFFLGTLFVPQSLSGPGAPHPVVTAFVAACAGRAD